MNKECTHQEYYSQYVTAGTELAVKRLIGVERIKESTDDNFNNIPLREWDNLKETIVYHCPGGIFKHLTGEPFYTLSDTVCIAKAAAEIIRMGK